MRRSELLIHLDILRLLAENGPSKITHIMNETKVSLSSLERYLDFMVQKNLIERQSLSAKRVIFAITPKGARVLRCYGAIQASFVGLSGLPY